MHRNSTRVGAYSYDLVLARDVIAIHDRASAERFVEALVRDRGEHAILEIVGDRANPGASFEDMRELLVARILEGTFVAVRDRSVPRLMSAPRSVPLIDPARPVPTEEPPVTDWVGLRLVRADDEPVADEPFEVRLPDGTIEKGRTDHDGRAHYDGVQRGRCRIVFLRIWATEWRDLELGAPSPSADAAGESTSLSAVGATPAKDADELESVPSELVSGPEDEGPTGTTWLAVEVEDLEGRALVGLELEITRPDGEHVVLATDGLGRVELEGLGDGVCKVRARSDEWSVPATSCATGSGYILRAKREGAA